MKGERIWTPIGPMIEAEIDQAIKKRLGTDPDLWVVEIDDRKGRHFLTDDVEGAC